MLISKGFSLQSSRGAGGRNARVQPARVISCRLSQVRHQSRGWNAVCCGRMRLARSCRLVSFHARLLRMQSVRLQALRSLSNRPRGRSLAAVQHAGALRPPPQNNPPPSPPRHMTHRVRSGPEHHGRKPYGCATVMTATAVPRRRHNREKRLPSIMPATVLVALAARNLLTVAFARGRCASDGLEAGRAVQLRCLWLGDMRHESVRS